MRFALVASVLVATAAPAAAADGTPTFTKDVAPIFYQNCIESIATMFAPMSLTTYEDARPSYRARDLEARHRKDDAAVGIGHAARPLPQRSAANQQYDFFFFFFC